MDSVWVLLRRNQDNNTSDSDEFIQLFWTKPTIEELKNECGVTFTNDDYEDADFTESGHWVSEIKRPVVAVKPILDIDSPDAPWNVRKCNDE